MQRYPDTLDHALTRTKTAMMAAIEMIAEMFERGYAEENPLCFWHS